MSYSIPDVLWEEIKMVIPVKKSLVGRPELDAKKCIDAIFGILKTGAQWASIPRSIAPHTTIHGKFRKWVKMGVFENIMNIARTFYQKNNPGWDIWFAIDGSYVKAPLGGEKTGKNPTDRSRLGSKKSMIVDQRGAPLGLAIGPANMHDSKLVGATLKSFHGSFKNDVLKIMAADSAYDSTKIKRDLREKNFIPLISINKRRSKIKFEKCSSRHRWIIERSHSWLNHFRSIRTRWARRNSSFLAFFQFACAHRLFAMSGIFV